MDLDISITEIMSTKLITLHPKDRLTRAKEVFDQYDIHHIPIAVMGELRGMVSLGDLLFLESVVTNSFDEFIQTKKMELSTIDSIMTTRPISITIGATLSDALDKMLSNRINALPIIDDDQLVGLVTSHDMMVYLRDACLDA